MILTSSLILLVITRISSRMLWSSDSTGSRFGEVGMTGTELRAPLGWDGSIGRMNPIPKCSSIELFFNIIIFWECTCFSVRPSKTKLAFVDCLHVLHVGLLSMEKFLIPLPNSTIFLQFLSSDFQYCCMTFFLMWYCFTLLIFASYTDKVPYFYYLLKTYKQIFN